MKPYVLVLVAALSGCATYNAITGATVSPQSALVAANSFDALETAATGYLQLPLCTTTALAACRSSAATKAIVPAVRSGRIARNQVEAMLSANNGKAIPVATMNTLQAAIATLQSIDAQYNIHP